MFSKVSIVILNWNGWKDTIECLESVFRIDYPNYRVIVVDNGSTNDSVERIKAWAEGEQGVEADPKNPLYYLSHPPVQKSIPYIEYDKKTAEAGGLPEKEKLLYEKLPIGILHPLILIQTGDNLGFAGGNNVGIKYALAKDDFDYVWILNNDTLVAKNALSEMFKMIESNKKIGVLGSKIMNYYRLNVIDVVGGGKFIPWLGIAIQIGNDEVDDGRWNKRDIDITYVKGASMLIRNKVIEDIGLIDESYFLYSEETDFCIRACRNKWKIAYCLSSIIWHKGERITGTENKENLPKFYKEYYIVRNNLILLKRFYKKYLPIGFLFLFAIKVLVIIFKKKRYITTSIKYVIKGYIDFLLGKDGKI